MREELQLHLDLLTEENVRRGMAPREAREAAHRAFGGVEQIKERCRDARGFGWAQQLAQDLRYAVRSVWAHKGFTAAAVLTIAIGIGVNTTIFSVIGSLVFQPAQRDRSQKLVAVHNGRTEGERAFRGFSYAEYQQVRAAKHLFAGVAAMDFVQSLLGEDAGAERCLFCLVSEDYFRVLNVQPVRGRFFLPEELAPAAAVPVAVASYQLWERKGRREDFVGSRIRIGRVEYTVIGVAPKGFGGLQWSIGPEAWLPLGMLPAFRDKTSDPAEHPLFNRQHCFLNVFAALAPGASIGSTRAALAALSTELNELNGTTQNGRRELLLGKVSRGNISLVWPADESVLGLYAFVAAVMTLFVLVIACLNVANMLFARGVSRQKEIAIRLCLGASRGRVIRQLLVEGGVLAVLGGAAGLLLSQWTLDLLLQAARSRAIGVSVHLQATTDWVLVAITSALCLGATLLFALAPALRCTRGNLADDLKTGGTGSNGTARWGRFFSLRNGLVMAQVALSVMLLSGATLLVLAVGRSEEDRGFAMDGRIVANLDYRHADTARSLVPTEQDRLLRRVAALPGVVSAALASAIPCNFEAYWVRLYSRSATGREPHGGSGDGGANAVQTLVSDGYFSTMGITLLQGREFTAAEATPGSNARVAVIDESFARTLFPDRPALGEYLAWSKPGSAGDDPAGHLQVVGIVKSPREDAFQGNQPQPRIYRPLGSAPGEMLNAYVVAKVNEAAGVSALAGAIRTEIRTSQPGVPLIVCEPLDRFVGRNLNVWTARVFAGLFGAFGLVAVVLAIVGVYGVKAHLVARRTREIGIRIAIGARPAQVMRLLLTQSLLQTGAGVLLGVVLAVASGSLLSKLMYRVSAAEPLALIVATVPVAAVALLAAALPAVRATRVDPTQALRTE